MTTTTPRRCWCNGCDNTATTTVHIILLNADVGVCDTCAKHLGRCDHFPCVCDRPSAASTWCSFHSVRVCLWCGGVLSLCRDPWRVGALIPDPPGGSS